MSFQASNDRIIITDTNGAIAFDTSRDMPHILGVYEFRVKKLFASQYWDKETFNLISLPANPDFLICRAELMPYYLDGVEFQRNYSPGEAFPPIDENLKATVGLQDGLGVAGRGSMFKINAGGQYFETPFALGVTPGSRVFFQGSLLLESGICQSSRNGDNLSVSPKRAMHLHVEPSWNNKLVLTFEQSECYSDIAWIDYYRDYPGNYTTVSRYGRTAVRWEVKLKVWAGTFRK